jgi:hypothetical protein
MVRVNKGEKVFENVNIDTSPWRGRTADVGYYRWNEFVGEQMSYIPREVMYSRVSGGAVRTSVGRGSDAKLQRMLENFNLLLTRCDGSPATG